MTASTKKKEEKRDSGRKMTGSGQKGCRKYPPEELSSHHSNEKEWLGSRMREKTLVVFNVFLTTSQQGMRETRGS